MGVLFKELKLHLDGCKSPGSGFFRKKTIFLITTAVEVLVQGSAGTRALDLALAAGPVPGDGSRAI